MYQIFTFDENVVRFHPLDADVVRFHRLNERRADCAQTVNAFKKTLHSICTSNVLAGALNVRRTIHPYIRFCLPKGDLITAASALKRDTQLRFPTPSFPFEYVGKYIYICCFFFFVKAVESGDGVGV